MQNVSNLQIPEGAVRTIHDKDNRLLWGRVAYNTKYAGDTSQEHYTGEQLLTKDGMSTPSTDTSFWYSFTSNVISLTPQSGGWGKISQLQQTFGNFFVAWDAVHNMAASTTYTLIIEVKDVVSQGAGAIDFIQTGQAIDPFASFEVITGGSASTSTVLRTTFENPDPVTVAKVTTKSSATAIGLRLLTRNTTPVGSSFTIRVTVLNGDHSSDWQNYAGANWQPYVGGTPSPNPDYPQDVQVVTGEQTVDIHGGDQGQTYIIDLRGKNLLNISDFAMGGLYNGNPSASTYRINNASHAIAVQPNTAYTLSAQLVSPVQGFRVGIHEIDRNGGFLRDLGWKQLGTGAFTMTTDPDTYYLKMVGSLSTTSTNVSTGGTEDTTACTTVAEFMRGCTLQLEKGTTATAYTPFTQTELCKIGEFQDYIYKSGDDWYVHKEIGKDTLDGTEIFQKSGVNDNVSFYWARNYSGQVPRFANIRESLITQTGAGIDYVFPFFSNRFPRMSTNQVIYSSSIGAGFNRPSTTNLNFRMGMGVGTTVNDATKFTNFVRNNPITVYYPLETFANTQITDATLIAQLNAVHQWLTRYGYNSIVTGEIPIIIDRTNL